METFLFALVDCTNPNGKLPVQNSHIYISSDSQCSLRQTRVFSLHITIKETKFIRFTDRGAGEAMSGLD